MSLKIFIPIYFGTFNYIVTIIWLKSQFGC